MENVKGIQYNNSQTWEAWIDSAHILWENTDPISIFLILIIPLGVFLYTHFQYIHIRNVKQNDVVDITKNEDDMGEGMNSYGNPLKSVFQKIESKMTCDEKDEEKRAQSEQLERIYSLMMDDKDKFAETSFDDVKNQMKFYCG